MPIKLRKTYQDGSQPREELANTIEVGVGISLSQTDDGLPVLSGQGSGSFLDLGTVAASGTLTPNFRDQGCNKATLSGAGITIANPTGIQDGGTYVLKLAMSAAGVTIATWGTAYKFPGGAKWVPTATAGAVDIITFVCEGTTMYAVAAKAFA